MQLPKISLSMVRDLWCIHIPLGDNRVIMLADRHL